MEVQSRTSLRILDFDTECRPMSYSEWRPESQITAIAWAWVDVGRIAGCELLEQDESNEAAMLEKFLDAYDTADIVTGHYIRRHDLPLVNDHCLRIGFDPLASKLTQDTMDIGAVKALGKSQDNLANTLGLTAEKHHMVGANWRKANGLSIEGRATAATRVINDVVQHMQLRRALLDRGALKAPRVWRP